MAELWMNAKRKRGYVRFKFQNGGLHNWDEILEVMLWMKCYMDIVRAKRALVILNTKMKDHYPIGELERHAKAASSLYIGRRIAFVNQSAVPERIRFIQSAMNHLGNFAIRSFDNEDKAVQWLLSDES